MHALLSRLRGPGLVGHLIALVAGGKPPDHEHDAFAFGGWRSWLLLTLGLATVIISSDFTVKSVVSLAEAFEVSQAIIAVLVIGLGTSLPELAATIASALRGHTEIALGNVIGSNIFNVLGILGVTALLRPIDVPPVIAEFDIWVMLAATAVLLVFARSGWRIGRREGAALMAGYVVYLIWLLRGLV